jgi:hypothetical protein
MKRFLLLSLFLSTITGILFLRCSSPDVAGGGTIETTNGIVGLVQTGDGEPAVNAIVKLFPDGYDPVAGDGLGVDFIDTCDADGNYRFSHIASGKYTVLARKRETALSSIVRDVYVTDESLTRISPATLDSSGLLTADFSSSDIPSEGYVYIPGTDISTSVGNDGSAILAGVPPGKVQEVLLSFDNNEKRNVLREEVTVMAGDTITIELPLWNYRRRIILNTSSTGADVTEDVTDFPVLIRLSSENFEFSQVRSDGSDLLFTGDDGSVLPSAIERWDAENGRAEI